MTERIIDFLDALVATVGSVDKRYCLVEKRADVNGTNIPYKYKGNGNYEAVNVDGGSVSYWRIVNSISFDVVDGNKAVKNLQATYPIRYVAMVRRDDINPLTFSQDVANVLEGRNKDLQTQLQAKNVNITVGSIDTDTVKIWGEEFAMPLTEPNYTRSMVMIDLTVTVIAARSCWESCDDFPDILQGFDWCDPSTYQRLTPDEIACLEGFLCGTCSDATVENSDGSYSATVASGGNLPLPNITFTDSDGSTSSVPSVQDITATPCSPTLMSINVYSDAGLTTPITTATLGQTVYINATVSGLTATNYSYTFHGDVETSADTVNNAYAWTVDSFGSVDIHGQADNGVTSAATVSAFVLTVSLDADAQSYINVLSAINANEKIRTHNLVTALKSGGVWSKLYALYPVFSDNAADQKWNMIDPQDLDAAYRLTYGGGMYNSKVGIAGNDSNAYADTHFNVSTDYISASDASLGVYNYGQKTGNKCAAGVGLVFSVSAGIMIYTSFSNFYYANAFGLSIGQGVNTNSNGLFVVTRGSTSEFSFHKRGSSTIDQTVVTGMSAIPNGNIWLCAGNPTSGSAQNSYSTALIGYAFIGKHLTTSEIDTIHSAFEDFKSCG